MITKRWRARVLLLVAGLSTGLLIGEIALRALGYYGARGAHVEHLRVVEDPVVDYRRIPNTSWIDNNLRYRINSHGWRDHEYAYRKPPGVFRIVVVGDSVTNGHGINLERNYAKVLEAMLSTATPVDPQYQVLLLSLGALNTEQEVHLLRVEGLRYEPDLVIVGYVLNDPEAGASLRRARRDRERYGLMRRVKNTAKRSSVMHLIYRSLQRLWWRARLAVGRPEVADYIDHDYYTVLHRDEKRWQTVLAALDRLKTVSRDEGFEVVVVIFPVLHELRDYRWYPIHEQVRVAATARGFRVLDLLQPFSRFRTATLQVAGGDHVHPNAVGHRVAAHAILELLQREILPSANEAMPAPAGSPPLRSLDQGF